MTIGNLIKSKRQEKGLTLDDLSAMIGVTAATSSATRKISRTESAVYSCPNLSVSALKKSCLSPII